MMRIIATYINEDGTLTMHVETYDGRHTILRRLRFEGCVVQSLPPDYLVDPDGAFARRRSTERQVTVTLRGDDVDAIEDGPPRRRPVAVTPTARRAATPPAVAPTPPIVASPPTPEKKPEAPREKCRFELLETD